MSTQKTLEVIVEMAAVYGVTLEPPALRAWKRVLADVDPRDVEAAATEWMRSEKWMPKPSEFVGRVEAARLRRVTREAAEHRRRMRAWRALTREALEAQFSGDPQRMEAVAERLEAAGRPSMAAAMRRRAAMRG